MLVLSRSILRPTVAFTTAGRIDGSTETKGRSRRDRSRSRPGSPRLPDRNPLRGGLELRSHLPATGMRCVGASAVKYAESQAGVIPVRCRSQSLTNGKARQTKRYTSEMIDWLAVYDRV